jgi:glutathione S-transferase
MILAAAGVAFEDIRIEWSQWPALKSSTPFNQLPMLEVDGVKISQSKTIARYLAVKFGFAGKDDLERAQADMIVDAVDDICYDVGSAYFVPDAGSKAELMDKLTNEKIPYFFTRLEMLLKENQGGDCYFVGDSMTWADIVFADLCVWLASLGFTIALEHFPKLAALKTRVESVPGIAEWIKKRPVTHV